MALSCFTVLPVIADNSAKVILEPSKYAFKSSFVMVCALYVYRFDYVCLKTGLSSAVYSDSNILASAIA